MHIAPWLPEFLEACPGLQIEFVEGVASVDLLEAKVDLAIRVAIETSDNLIVRRLGTSRVVVVAAPEYLARYGTPSCPAEVAAHRTIGFSPLFWAHEWRFRRDGEAVNVPVRPVVLTNAAETLRGAALSGVGLTALPDWMVSQELASGRLIRVLCGWEAAESGIYAIFPSNRLLTAKVKLFADFAARRLRQLAAAGWRSQPARSQPAQPGP